MVDYILDKDKGTRIVARDGLFMENGDTIAMSFNVQSQMNGKVAKPVGHIALSFAKEDEPRLTDRAMAVIALEYMERMGIRHTQFFIARHFDKEHPYVHIAYNRIDNDAALQRNRNEDRIGLMLNAHKVTTPSVPSSATTHVELFNSSLGLLNGSGSSFNAADAEANQEMVVVLRKKKAKRKKGMSL